MFPPPPTLSNPVRCSSLFQLHFPVNTVNGFRSACIAGLVASFPGSSAPEREIELLHTEIHIRVLGEPGNKATGLDL